MALVLRNRTALFEQFRRSYRTTVVPVRQKAYFDNEQYTGLAQDPSDAIELHLFTASASASAAPPSPLWQRWCSKKAALERLFGDINRSIERLQAEYVPSKILAINWQTNGPPAAASDLAAHLLEQIAGRMIEELAELPLESVEIQERQDMRDYTYSQVMALKKSVRQAMVNRLGRCAEFLRAVQAERNKSIPVRQPRSDPPEIAVIEARRTSPTIQLSKPAADGPFSGEDALLLLTDPRTFVAQEREDEIERIAESMSQVLALLQSMQSMVIEQGSLLDRIDYNLERGQKYIRRANTLLHKKNLHQSTQQSRQLLLLFLVLLVLLLLIAVFARSGTQRY